MNPSQVNPYQVNLAFDILIKEIQTVIDNLDQEIKLTVENKDYEKTQILIQNIKTLNSFLEKVKNLQIEWNNTFIDKLPNYVLKNYSLNETTINDEATINTNISFTNTNKKKLKKGLRTPKNEFRIPILEALFELGGKAKVRDVLKKVEEKMKNKLSKYDYDALPFNPSEIRWRNTAQWCRYSLVKEGLLSDKSLPGIWEITPKGIQYLNEYKRLNNETTINTNISPTNTNQKTIEKDLRTPEHEFRIPILEALFELGGKAKVRDVLKKVEEKMKNTAKWCRKSLVKEGLLYKSVRGTWVITPKGIEYLNEYKKLNKDTK